MDAATARHLAEAVEVYRRHLLGDDQGTALSGRVHCFYTGLGGSLADENNRSPIVNPNRYFGRYTDATVAHDGGRRCLTYARLPRFAFFGLVSGIRAADFFNTEIGRLLRHVGRPDASGHR